MITKLDCHCNSLMITTIMYTVEDIILDKCNRYNLNQKKYY